MYIYSYNIRLPCFCMTLNPTPLAAHCLVEATAPVLLLLISANYHHSAVLHGAQRLPCTQTMSLLIIGTCLKCDLCFFSLTVAVVDTDKHSQQPLRSLSHLMYL